MLSVIQNILQRQLGEGWKPMLLTATSHPEKACPVPGLQPGKPHSSRGPSKRLLATHRDSGPPGLSGQRGRGQRVGEGTGGSQQQQVLP